MPPELKEGAYGLGLTRWEMVRGVVLPYTRGGVVAAILLGIGRAVGEAIAVTQVIGGLHRHPDLALPVRATRSRAASPPSTRAPARTSHVASLVYLAVILLVFALLVNFAAQVIVNRFELKQAGVS